MNKKVSIDQGRYVSLLTRDTLALVLAGGQGSRLRELTDWRAKPAMHFGGKYRIIDFPLSNCINSGVRRIGVLTQYKAHSLIQHIGHAWISRFQPGNQEFVEVLPASQRTGGEWYKGTADAIFQNLDIVRYHDPSLVLILAGDHIYKMDYGPLLAWHRERDADMSICCVEMPCEEAAGQMGVISVDEQSRVIGFDEKPESPNSIPGKPGICLASMGNYVFNTDFLCDQLGADANLKDSDHDFGKDVIPSIIGNSKVYAYPFRDPDTDDLAYWRDVGTLDAFWEANIEMVEESPRLNLYDNKWPIYTQQPQLPPAKFVHESGDNRRGMALRSMVSAGCIVSGAIVRHSLLFSNSRIHSYSEVQDSVILPSVVVGENCRIRNAIIDRGARIPNDMVIGEDAEADRNNGFRVSEKGRVLVTAEMLGQDFHRAK